MKASSNQGKEDIYVNIGCGPIHHPRWLNLDVEPTDPVVTPLDVREGIPLAEGAATACFSSHVIEHLSPSAAQAFFADQYRVLRRGGIIRVVCPDLAELARTYLAEYERSRECPIPTYQHRHLTMELVDQMVRREPSGHMARLWSSASPSEREWTLQRSGYVSAGSGGNKASLSMLRKSWMAFSTRTGRRRAWQRIRDVLHTSIAYAVGGARLARIVREGIFQDSGEVHRWMYDDHALSAALREVGFVDPRRMELGNSEIPDWLTYGLELRDGIPLKPHSLVVEAKKPA